MTSKLSIDAGKTFIQLKDMSDQQVKSAVKEIKGIASCDESVRDMLDGISASNDRDLLAAILELGDVYIDICSYPL
jgi:hypothetical protein